MSNTSGLMTATEIAERWGWSLQGVLFAHRQGRMPAPAKTTRPMAWDAGDILIFERTRGPGPRAVYTVEDMAEQLGVDRSRIRYAIQAYRIRPYAIARDNVHLYDWEALEQVRFNLSAVKPTQKRLADELAAILTHQQTGKPCKLKIDEREGDAPGVVELGDPHPWLK